MNYTRRESQQRMERLIENTSELFANSGGVNTDYADFATIALAEFKTLLADPALTDRQLKQLIRKANTSHRSECPECSWAVFMARHIANQANANKRLETV